MADAHKAGHGSVDLGLYLNEQAAGGRLEYSHALTDYLSTYVAGNVSYQHRGARRMRYGAVAGLRGQF